MAVEWPWQYSFPPFFTIQPVESTKYKQLEEWCNLVLNYCKVKRVFVLDLGEAGDSELFFNKSISRRLSSSGVSLVVDCLVKRGRAEWCDQKKRRTFIYWRRPEEWGSLIHKWIQQTGKSNTVCTLYELRSGPDVMKEDFYQLDEDMLLKALRCLEGEKKAELIGTEGVKFF